MAAEHQHYHGHRKRLRERFAKSGLQGLADYEVVELLLTLAIPRSDVMQPAKRLIDRFKNLRGILDAPLNELESVDGLGSVAPIALRIIRETATLCLQQTAEQRDCLAEPEALEQFWRAKIGALKHEVFRLHACSIASRKL